MTRKWLGFLPWIFLVLFCAVVFKPFWLQGKLPIPADTIVGLYHPFRDLYRATYPNGVPYKNFLITDSVRQEYPWRELAISELKAGRMPVWNPFQFSGYPLLGNIQSAVFYPLNFLYWLLPFSSAWSWQVVLQIVLGGAFMIIFLQNMRLAPGAIALGVLGWVGSGFFTSWLETNTVVQTAIWLPLILFCVDKISVGKKTIIWCFLLVLSISSMLSAGHLQTAGYILLAIAIYSVVTCLNMPRRSKILWQVGVSFFLGLLVSCLWLLPALRFIIQSGRSVDQVFANREDWFIPWKNLAQFVAPDYFGNPATLNYFGVWNYGEFVGYIGLGCLLFSFLGSIVKDSRKKVFIIILLIASLFALPNPVAELPFRLNIPLISTSQPSRLIFLMDFSLVVLSALGADYFLRIGKSKLIFMGSLIFVGVLFVLSGIALSMGWQISLHNLYLPWVVMVALLALLTLTAYKPKYKTGLFIVVLAIIFLDLTRFVIKFESFSVKEWLFPETAITRFLAQNMKNSFYRVGTLDDRIAAPNLLLPYHIPMVSGYDPLYLSRYGELVAAIERNEPNIKPPFGFNRIIIPKNFNSPLFDLLGVRYLLSLNPLGTEKYKLVFSEGETKIYEAKMVSPRAFIPNEVIRVSSREQAIFTMYSPGFNIQKLGVVEENVSVPITASGEAKIISYQPNKVVIQSMSSTGGLLVLTDPYFSDWVARVDGRETKIYLADYAFRGVVVPPGNHLVEFYMPYKIL